MRVRIRITDGRQVINNKLDGLRPEKVRASRSMSCFQGHGAPEQVRGFHCEETYPVRLLAGTGE